MRNNRIRMLSGVGAAAVLLFSMGCETAQKDERSEGRALDDKHITENVRQALQKEPVYKFDSVTVNTFAGIVQLSGFVETDLQKRRAQEVAQHVAYPSTVVNGIALKPMMATSIPSSEERIYSEPQNPNPNTQKNAEPK